MESNPKETLGAMLTTLIVNWFIESFYPLDTSVKAVVLLVVWWGYWFVLGFCQSLYRDIKKGLEVKHGPKL